MKKNPVFENLVACIVNHKSREFSEILENNPINLNLKDGKGWTLLHYAAQYLAIEIGEILISNGADINAKDNFGNNILWRATFASNGRGEFISLLLKNNVDKFDKNESGISPIDLANTISNYNVKQYF